MTFIKEFFNFYSSFLVTIVGKRRFFNFNSIYKKAISILLLGNILSFMLGLLLMVTIAYTFSIFNYPKPTYNNLLKHTGDCINNYLFLPFLFGCILAPIFEELVFRLPLRYTKANLIISIIALYLLTFISKNAMCALVNGTFIERFKYEKFILFLGITALTVVLVNIKAINKLLIKIINEHGWWLYILLSILFGIIHTEPIRVLANLPWLIAQGGVQIAFGLYWGYLRLTYGIKYSIMAHAVWNFLILILTHNF
jgi:membrane protease YdiL (CAAX protease family)